MDPNRKILLDGGSTSVMDDIKKEIELHEQMKRDSRRISLELKPFVESVYRKAGKEPPWREVTE